MTAAIGRWLPMRAWRHRVNTGTLRQDAAAGLSGAPIVPPQGVTCPTIAGLIELVAPIAMAAQVAGPLCERRLCFAQARHPQNLHRQVVS
jgi:hypothetical protein